MSGEPQLERSVLEAKERDELQAIAEALGQKPAARAKKGDLVDLILQATGVLPAAPAKPRRTVRKRVAPGAASNGDAAPTLGLDDGPSDPVSPSDAEPGEPAETHGGDGAEQDDAPTDPLPVASAPVAAVTAAVAPEASEPVAVVAAADPVLPPTARRPAAPEPGPEPRSQPQPQARVPYQPPGPPGPGNHASPAPGAQPAPSAGQPSPQGQPAQPGQQSAPGGVDGEVRRNRRRRGRDRERVGNGYDQQVQQADQAFAGDPLSCDGLLELRPEGFGFLRTSGYLPGPDDVYVSTSQVRKFALRAGDRIVGTSRPATTQERYGALLRIDAVGDQAPDEARRRPRFEDLTPRYPDERLRLASSEPTAATTGATTARIIDLLAPIGKGQRGMIVSPPKAGRTTVIKQIAAAIEANHPEVDLVVLLVDERPEEVTDLRRRLQGEVVGSTFDRPAEEHAQVAELVIEVAKRRVELGRDVVVIVDGITRLARAYNLAGPASGRVLASGLDSGAVAAPLRLFAAARNVEEGGSLTIIATALVETGSPVDGAIFEEFTSTANMELRLDSGLAERRRYPAIDVTGSSTRHEELLRTEEELRLVWQLRRALVGAGQHGAGHHAYELLVDLLTRFSTNADLLADLARTPAELAGTDDRPLPLEGSL